MVVEREEGRAGREERWKEEVVKERMVWVWNRQHRRMWCPKFLFIVGDVVRVVGHRGDLAVLFWIFMKLIVRVTIEDEESCPPED